MKSITGPTVTQVLDAVEHALMQRDLGRGKSRLRRVSEVMPEHPRVFHLEGLIRHAEKQDDLAIPSLSRSLLLRPDNPWAVMQLGVILMNAGKANSAIEVQRWAVVLALDDVPFLNNLASALTDLGRPEDAIDVVSRALRADPGHAETHARCAKIYLKQGVPLPAWRAAARAIVIGPDQYPPYLTASSAAWDMGKVDKAWLILENATRLSGLDREIAANRAWIALKKRAPDVVMSVAGRGLLATPDDFPLMTRYCAGEVERDGRIGKFWRFALCLGEMKPELVDQFSVRGVVNWSDLSAAKSRPTSIEILQPTKHTLADHEARARTILKIRSATVMPRSQAILAGDATVLHEGWSPFSMMTGWGDDGEFFHWLRSGRAVSNALNLGMTVPEAILLGMGGHGNYYHWLIDFVPRLYTLSKFASIVGVSRSTPFLVPDDCPRAIRELLGYLGVAESALILAPHASPVAVERLFVPAMPSSHPRTMSEAIRHLNAVLEPRLENWISKGDVAVGAERVYLDRRAARDRRILNEDALCALLSRHGFDIITPDTSSIRQQIASLGKAKVVISGHGAGLANMVFAPAGCEIIELTYTGDNPAHLKALASACGHRRRTLVCPTVRDLERRPGKWDMRVPLGELESILSERFG